LFLTIQYFVERKNAMFQLNESNAKFIDAKINVIFQNEPVLEKKPCCPDAFEWNQIVYPIEEQIMEWVDYSRRGRMARNISDAHYITASSKGSWGGGRFFFRVRTKEKRIFDIYYDRAPKGTSNRKGQWFLFKELI
jgi:hypothetical protein